MALSNSQQFETDSRDRLYFDQFEYSMRFRLLHSGRMRDLAEHAIVNSCAHARHLSQIMRGPRQSINDQQEQDLLAMAEIFRSFDQPYKRIVYSDWQYVYTNDLHMFDAIAGSSGLAHISYHRAVVDQPRNTVVLKHSDYQYRSYFREAWYTQDQIQTLQQFLLSRPQQFRMTDYWRSRWKHRHIYITRSNFVDHHDAQDVLLLQMTVPGCIRKTLPIVQSQ